MDVMLRHYRARLVKKYRLSPKTWPDGIDSKSDRWYGDGSGWPDQLVDLWSTVKWADEQFTELGKRGVGVRPHGQAIGDVTSRKVDVTLVTPDVTPTVTLTEKQRLQAKERMRRKRERDALELANPKEAKADG
jgi:hypothetical protein